MKKEKLFNILKKVAFWRGKVTADDVEAISGVSNKTARTTLSNFMEMTPDIISKKSGATISTAFFDKDSTYRDDSSYALATLLAANILCDESVSVLPKIPADVAPNMISGVDEETLRTIAQAMNMGQDFTITYVGMKLNEQARDRVISPAKLIWSNGRWHLQAVDKEISEVRDFVLSRILRVFDVVKRTNDYKDMIAAEYEEVEIPVKPHSRLTEEQAMIVASQYGIGRSGGVLRVPKYYQWYVKKRLIAGPFEMPPSKLLEPSDPGGFNI